MGLRTRRSVYALTVQRPQAASGARVGQEMALAVNVPAGGDRRPALEVLEGALDGAPGSADGPHEVERPFARPPEPGSDPN